ncbi:c-type cytochrome [Chryseobacterium sp. JV558]|uniref:c-type cytochrome n=1 Tax=Chryseobacterium sp. JV558 TaxID=2663236 RepID=UPI00299DA8D5|nr:c-type cytochrome [Chryseobacterium sp. JV558]MDW9381486.1 c-type cytochrome [Chryseobacterium sp. JV558]
MKKLLVTAVLFSLAVTSCSDKKDTDPTPQPQETNTMLEEPKPQEASPAATPLSGADAEIAEGKSLVEGTDCLSCHKIDSKLVGPAYQEVAAKYKDADIDMLAQKIIDGGKGNWGEIPMTPHAGLSKDNAKLMVKYILSLKK